MGLLMYGSLDVRLGSLDSLPGDGREADPWLTGLGRGLLCRVDEFQLRAWIDLTL